MTAALLIRNARRASRLSQVALSERSGIAQSSISLIESGDRAPDWTTVDRLLASTGRGMVAIPTRREDAATIASRIAQAEKGGDDRRAARTFIQLADNLAAEHDEVRFALTVAEPASTGRKHWDAALAALVEFRLSEEGLPLPRWARDPARALSRSWTFRAGDYVVPVDPQRVPKPFLDRKVLIDSDTLVSV